MIFNKKKPSLKRISSAQEEIVEKTNRLSREFWEALNATGEVPLYDGHQLTAQQRADLETEKMTALAKARMHVSTSCIQSVPAAARAYAAPATQQQPGDQQSQPISVKAQQISTHIPRRK